MFWNSCSICSLALSVCKDVCIRYILLWIWWELLRIQRGLDNSSKCWQGANIVLRLVHFHYLLARMFEYATFVWRSSGNCYESSRVWLTHQNVGKMLNIVLRLTIFISGAPAWKLKHNSALFAVMHLSGGCISMCTGPLTPPTNIKHCGCQSCASIENVLIWQYCASVFNNSIYIRT